MLKRSKKKPVSSTPRAVVVKLPQTERDYGALLLLILLALLLVGIVFVYLNRQILAERNISFAPVLETQITNNPLLNSNELSPYLNGNLEPAEYNDKTVDVDEYSALQTTVKSTLGKIQDAVAFVPEESVSQPVVASKKVSVAAPVVSPKPKKSVPQKIKKGTVAIIITDIGISTELSKAIIKNLPAAISIAVSPYSEDADLWVSRAKNVGHNALLMVPMEPLSYARNNPGNNALLTSLSWSENEARLGKFLRQAYNYDGIISYMGSRFATNLVYRKKLQDFLAKKQLFYVDGREVVLNNPSLYTNTVVLDAILDEKSVVEQFAKLEKIARSNGVAVGLMMPYPLSFELLQKQLALWKDKNITVVPVSDVVVR